MTTGSRGTRAPLALTHVRLCRRGAEAPGPEGEALLGVAAQARPGGPAGAAWRFLGGGGPRPAQPLGLAPACQGDGMGSSGRFSCPRPQARRRPHQPPCSRTPGVGTGLRQTDWRPQHSGRATGPRVPPAARSAGRGARQLGDDTRPRSAARPAPPGAGGRHRQPATRRRSRGLSGPLAERLRPAPADSLGRRALVPTITASIDCTPPPGPAACDGRGLPRTTRCRPGRQGSPDAPPLRGTG